MRSGLIEIARHYGVIEFGGVDIADQVCASIDLRTETGATPVVNETRLVEPGVFKRSVFKPAPGTYPVGEIRMWYAGHEVSVVGDMTGRAGVIEITPHMLDHASKDPAYALQLRTWIQSHC